jgi:hypothetical protein
LVDSGQQAGHNVRIWYTSLEGIEQPELAIFCFPRPVRLAGVEAEALHTLVILVAPRSIVGLDLRLAGHLAELVQTPQFERDWLEAPSPKARQEILMRDDHFLHAPISEIPFLAEHVGRRIGEIELPGSCLVALIERDGELLTAKSQRILREGDEVAVIGEPEDLKQLV